MKTIQNTISDLDVIILCGGYGTRLQSVITDRPKPLAPVGGRPFLDILVEDLLLYDVKRVIFSVGYMKEKIIERYQCRTDADYFFAKEDTPLGTGGAVRNAMSFVKSDTFLVLNGDSRCSIDFNEFYKFHKLKSSEASFVLVPLTELHDGGLINIDANQKIIGFKEKDKTVSNCFLNAGIYLFDRNIDCFESDTHKFSLEHEIFPKLISLKKCFGFIAHTKVFDIGTPERYREINKIINSK